MSFENEFVQSLAGHVATTGGNSKLILAAQTVSDGQVVGRVYVPKFARIGALVTSRDVTFERRLGHCTGKCTIPWPAYPALLTALNHWEAHRDDWWAFYSSNSGFPGGMGGADYIARPGKDSEHNQVYKSVMGHRKGSPLTGADKVLPVEQPEALSLGVRVVARIVRVNEPGIQEPNPWVGVVYQIADDLQCKAWRQDVELKIGHQKLWIEHYELGFLRELLHVR